MVRRVQVRSPGETTTKLEKAKQILGKWIRNDSSFPWRATDDPYQLVLAELMLVRTNAKQAARVWTDFVNRFPDVTSVARAPASEIATCLAPLGLRWRAKRIHSLMKHVELEHGGAMPQTSECISELLPTGQYVAKAAALQVAGRGALPVDTGVARFLTRSLGLEVAGDARRSAAVREAATRSGEWTREEFYGLIDLTRTKCRQRTPLCDECPLVALCEHGIRRPA